MKSKTKKICDRIPKAEHLTEDLLRLEEMGLVKIIRPKGKSEQHWKIGLTAKGEKIGKAIWGRTPDIFRDTAKQVKKDVLEGKV